MTTANEANSNACNKMMGELKSVIKDAEELLKKALVVTVPGKEFGMEGFIRLSFAGSVKDVTEGMARIRWALDPTSPNEIYIGDKKLIRDWL